MVLGTVGQIRSTVGKMGNIGLGIGKGRSKK